MAIDKKIAPPLHTLDKCNPRLSGNIKFVCDSDDIYIDSINSTPELTRSLYKSYKVNQTSNLMVNAKNFFNLFVTKDDIFSIKDDKNYVVTNYQNQHDRIYNYGAYSDTSELLQKRFRFFAPLYINEEAERPDLFLIYRIDREKFNNGEKGWKKELVFTHDFRTSSMGKQLDRHINYLKDYPHDMGVFANYGDNLSYTGTSISSGLMESRYEDDFDSLLANERTLTEFNNYVVDGFKRNGLIDSRYLNLEFSFDVDLSNEETNDKFLDVIGVYVTLDELNNIKEYNTSDYDFKLLEDNKTIKETLLETITDDVLQDNFINVGDYLGVQYTNESSLGNFPPIVMIKPNFIPSIGSKISLSFEGNTEITYIIKESDIVSNDIIKTAENIAESFSEFARVTPSNIFVSAFVHNKEYIVIKSLINDDTYNNISVSFLPSQYKIITPIFNKLGVYNNTFYSPSNKSVVTLSPIGTSLTQADSLRLNNTISKLVFGARYLDLYFFNTDISLKSDNTDSEVFETIKTEKSKMYEAKIIEHRKFDFDRETSYHTDVFDFELTYYRQWLLNEINKSNFLGKYKDVVPQPTSEVISSYKSDLIGIVERYFNSISLNRSMLFKDINTDDFVASTTDNEYNRLKENDNINLLKTDITVQHINKFMFSNGLDVYNRPYMMNLGLPFRYGNFAPSLDNPERDLRDSTHSWLVIGEGLPPYFDDININGNKVIKNVEVETEQVVNIIDRVFSNIGEQTDIDLWQKNSVDLTVGSDGNNMVFRQLNSLGYIERPFNIKEQSIIGISNFSYHFILRASANTNVNVRFELISVLDDTKVYHTWDVNKNVVGGGSVVVNDNVKFKLPNTSDDVKLRISLPVGHSCVAEWYDINFFKGTIVQKTLDETIDFDSDKIMGIEKNVPDMISGYTTIPITTKDILSENIDVYNYIRSHSIIRLEDDNGTCFFRGVKCVLDKKYVGWKFASVLITRSAPIGEDRAIQLYENNVFKSITLVVNMYIPEPVLTSLEQPNTYWLDRSLLYFSDGNYATETSLASFGLEDFSATIHDTINPKEYLGEFVTNDWYFQRDGQNYIHVNRGIAERFNVNFESLLTLGEDFQVFFSNTDDSETVHYGMLITFKEVQEIRPDFFWCKEIDVRIKEVNSGVVSVIEYSMLERFLANNNVFLEENKMDIVEAILLENAKYDRVLKNTSAIQRFSLISTASIFDWLSANKVKVNVEGGKSFYSVMGAFKPTINEAVISYKEVDKDIINLDQKYTNLFVRQNGAYNAVTKRLRKVSGKFTIDYTNYVYSNKASNNDLLPLVQTNKDRENGGVWFYRKDDSNTNMSNHFRYYTNRKDYLDIPWLANPIEYKHELSRILSSSNIVEFEHIYDGNVIDIYGKIKDYLFRILENTDINFNAYTQTEKIEIMRLSNKDIDSLTFDQYSFEDIITNRFYKSVINDIYNVVSVTKQNEDKIDFYEVDDDIIQLSDDIEIGTNIIIKIDRV